MDYSELTDAELGAMGIIQEQGQLPIGLIAAPFLANVALTCADRAVEAQFQDRLKKQDFAIARYMDDITVVATDKELIQAVLRCYSQQLPSGLTLNQDKTEPKGLLSEDRSVGVEWKVLTRENLTPFSTTTLNHLSDIGEQDFRAMNAYERRRMGAELVRLVHTEFSTTEIRPDTKLSFASWRLKELALQSHALHLKKEYRSLREQVEACLRMAPTKLGIIQSTLSLLLEAGETRKLKVFLLRWFFRQGAYWGPQEPAGQFVRGYVLHLIASEVQRFRREGNPVRENLHACFGVIQATLQSFYGDKEQGGWYERAALYWLLAHMNRRLNIVTPSSKDESRHVAWSRQLYLFATAVRGKPPSLSVLPEGAATNLLLQNVDEWRVVATAACLAVLAGDDRQRLVKSRLKTFWDKIPDLERLVSGVPRAIYRLVSLYAEYTPATVVERLLQLGPVHRDLQGVPLAMESEEGAIWRTAIQIWFETHLYQDDGIRLVARMKQELGARIPVAAKHLLGIMERRIMDGPYIPLSRWIWNQWQVVNPESAADGSWGPPLQTELEITNLMIRLVQFVRRNANRYSAPGSLHLDSIAIRPDARPGHVKDTDLEVVPHEFVDDRYTSGYALVRSLVSEEEELAEVHMSYALAIILLRLLQRRLDGGTSQMGLRKLRPWHHLGSVFTMAHYPSSVLAGLIAGALQFDQYLFRRPAGRRRRVLEPLPVNTLEHWRRVLGAHWQSLKRTRYLGQEAWEAYQIDLDDFFPAADGNRVDLGPTRTNRLPQRLKVIVAQLSNPDHRFDLKRRLRVKREWYGRTQDLVVAAMQTAEQEREREAGELREQWLERQRAAKLAGKADKEAARTKLEEPSPVVVVLPELYLPRGMEYSLLVPWARHLEAIVIAGREYGPVPAPTVDTGEVVNDAVVVVPSGKGRRSRVTVIPVPKLTAPPQEEEFLEDASGRKASPYRFRGGRAIYLFHSSVVGNFAVLICFDFLNLPIQALLQGNIQTLYVIAHNSDLSTYDAVAEAAIRLLHCNVVICNVADYGGSLAVTPYKNAHERERLRFRGNGIEGAVAVSIPLQALARHQADGKPDTVEETYNPARPLEPAKRPFKPLPPDFGTLRARISKVPARDSKNLR
jgi:hypothetical protein